MDPIHSNKIILREQHQWDRGLVLLRESALCWEVGLNGLTPETQHIFDEIELEMMRTLQNFWGEKSSILFDRKNRTAHATDEKGLCMNLVTGELIEWKEEGA